MLAFTYRDVLRSMLLVPIAYLIFVFRLIAGGIGQHTLWVSFVVLSTIIAIISLVMRPETQTKESAIKLEYPTRLQTWLNTVKRKEHSQYFKWNLAQDLSNLLTEAIAYNQGITRDQVNQQLQSGNIDLPPDILDYLRISQTPFSYTGLVSNTNNNWLVHILKYIFKRPSQKLDKSPLDLEHERIIHFLEEFLNIDPEIWEG